MNSEIMPKITMMSPSVDSVSNVLKKHSRSGFANYYLETMKRCLGVNWNLLFRRNYLAVNPAKTGDEIWLVADIGKTQILHDVAQKIRACNLPFHVLLFAVTKEASIQSWNKAYHRDPSEVLISSKNDHIFEGFLNQYPHVHYVAERKDRYYLGVDFMFDGFEALHWDGASAGVIPTKYYGKDVRVYLLGC